ncbi:glycine betaine uptake BCCT transporter [Halalkalibacter akibai]|uniref:Glycine betaine transporter OpuD n=1 Tax=Halalkalibacter akibai (strain ATCC 43226 / DSM 21942 / CIP 109018 / JCM 9157 / 1139) TaxID=1236973 RepID=W4QPE0_HALA3|nr:BCCT family transporter [Halalkalibacter akibai]GAE33787.1 glycine betaine transporter OpuD [Halalkalibacter akibai JCM 9157]
MRKVTPVFYISVAIALAFILWGLIAPGHLETVTTQIQSFITHELGWFYLLAATAFLIFCIYLIFSPYGKIKLGKPEDKPDYNYLTWFAFLFTAGMGIGLVFWGVAEPLYHFFDPPTAESGTNQAAGEAMRYAFFHWGLHPWAIYSVVALSLAYFRFRKESPAVMSAVLNPLIGDRSNGGVGTAINVLVVFATIFGVATSLGFGAAQISAGLGNLVPGLQGMNEKVLQLIVIIVVTVLFMVSAQTGLDKGIRILSKTNVYLAISLMLFVLLFGPTSYIMGVFTQGVGSYLQNLAGMSFRLDIYNPETTWVEGWTIFYWAWWISWAPFVGTFIARVSKGRTIREFIIGVLAVPSIFGAFWFAVFGGTGIQLQRQGTADVMGMMSEGGMEIALFAVLEQFPLGLLLSIIAVFLISSFFVTSADSATVVLGMQTTNGDLNPPNSVKFVWGLIISATAAVLLSTDKGLGALQTAAIIAALPFTIIMIMMIFSLMKSLQSEKPTLASERERIILERYELKKEREKLKAEKSAFKKEKNELKKKN